MSRIFGKLKAVVCWRIAWVLDRFNDFLWVTVTGQRSWLPRNYASDEVFVLHKRVNEHGASGKAFPSLSQEYSDRRRGTFAHCRGCKVTYWDDVPNYGSLLCPRCWEFVLVRGWVAGETGVVEKAGEDDAPPDECMKRLNLSDLAHIRNALLYCAQRNNYEVLAAECRRLERSLPTTACSLIFDAKDEAGQ